MQGVFLFFLFFSTPIVWYVNARAQYMNRPAASFLGLHTVCVCEDPHIIIRVCVCHNLVLNGHQ